MLNTIEDLEKEIDEFQNNMSASGEIVQALKQMVDQMKQQNYNYKTLSQQKFMSQENKSLGS